MSPQQRQQITRLFVALEYGEQLAQRCATHQAGLVQSARAQHFLRAQAKQESMHGFIFRQAANWLLPRHRLPVPTALLRFGYHLQQAMQRHDLTECLVGSQIVLEGFGEQILQRLNQGMDKLNIGLSRQRQLILRQEQSHYAFGLHTLKTRLEQELVTTEGIHALAEKYLQLSHDITCDMAEVFSVLDEDASEYITGMTEDLPDWLFRSKP